MSPNTFPYTSDLLAMTMSKSHTYKYIHDLPPYRRIDTRLDGLHTWYTVACTREVKAWILQQNTLGYHSYPEPAYAKVYGSTFDIREDLFTMLVLRFG
jgi:hypothetical protein